jgi:hypothetical protein
MRPDAALRIPGHQPLIVGGMEYILIVVVAVLRLQIVA